MFPDWLNILLLPLGLYLLVKGADWLVDGAAAICYRLKIPEIVVGLTVVAFGTSAPELIVNILASFSGNSEIAMGNILGSNMANVLLILGVSAFMVPIAVSKNTFRFEMTFHIAVILLLALLIFTGSFTGERFLTRADGFWLLASFGIFWAYTISITLKGRKSALEEELPANESQTMSKSMFMVLLGVLGLFLGGKWVVDGAVTIASKMGISEGLIGITIVAIGTSLPELAASVSAARKNKADFILGNVLGSNMFNILWVLGLSSVIRPMPYNSQSNMDVWGNIAVAILLFALTLLSGRKLRRLHGSLFLILYLGYIASAALFRAN